MGKYGKVLFLLMGVLTIFVLTYLWMYTMPLKYEFKDERLMEAVEDLKSGYMDVVTLDLRGRGIEDLSGIGNFIGLRELHLDDNRISSLIPLKDLRNLQVLTLSNNLIDDGSPLESLVHLKELDLSYNSGLRDINFARSLVELKKLNLRQCDLRNLKPLRHLKSLRYLNLHSNPNIKSISRLYGLTGLKTLILRNVPLGDDLKYIENMIKLERLNIRNTKVDDLSPLYSLMKRGALQDNDQLGITADVDIRDNPVIIQKNWPLGDYWPNITLREPVDLPEIFPVEFSKPGGFYMEEFELTMSIHNENAVIYYTLDGSVPDPANINSNKTYRIKDPVTGEFTQRETTTYIYEEPIKISKDMLKRDISLIPTTTADADPISMWKEPADDETGAVVIRAVAHVDDLRSAGNQATYFLGERPSLPVISLIVDPENLFDYETGIYVPGEIYDSTLDYEGSWMQHPANYHTKTEYPVHVEFFEGGGIPGFSLNGGIRIHGGWSRSKALKNLRIYARSQYGIIKRINYDLFEEGREGSYKRVMLRAGFEDALWQNHARDEVHVDLLAHRPVIHYINGEYWGFIYLSERFDRYYLQDKYGVDPDEVTILEGPSGVLVRGDEACEKEFKGFLDFVRENDMALDDNYEHVKSMADILSFIDYNIVRIYSSCEDAIIKHIKVWKVPGEKWRWHTWDFDYALNNGEGYTIDVYGNDDENKHHDPKHTELFTRLLKNKEFRELFLNRFCDLINTLYSPERLIESLDKETEKIIGQMPSYVLRWRQYEYLGNWDYTLNKHKNFALMRPDIQIAQLDQYFGERGIHLGSPCGITLLCDPGEGKIIINSLKGESIYEGIYFEHIPSKVTAVPEKGYGFSHWLSDGEYLTDSPSHMFLPREGLRLEAVFVKE